MRLGAYLTMQLLPQPQNHNKQHLKSESQPVLKEPNYRSIKDNNADISNDKQYSSTKRDNSTRYPNLRASAPTEHRITPEFMEFTTQENFPAIAKPEKKNLKRVAKSFQEERVAIFIDGANLFYAAMHLNLEIDYTKLLRCLTKERQLLRAYFYTPVDNTNEKQQGFLLWMRRNGYRVFTKELVYLPDGSKKANMDVEIAVDMLTLARYCDTLILLSGDGDLAYAVNAIAYQGVQIEVVSLSSMTSESLIDVADCYTDLDEIRQEIQK